MPKTIVNYVCQQCGYVSPQSLGKCPECGNWNSFVETAVSNQTQKLNIKNQRLGTLSKPIKLTDIKEIQTKRISTGITELDYVLGGGIVPGQVILLAGEPGVGKSTLLLQLVRNVGAPRVSPLGRLVGDEKKAGTSPATTILYASGEESAEQIYLRARRLGLGELKNLLLLNETNVESVIESMESIQQHTKSGITTSNPSFLIVDSIQTLWTENLAGAPGSVGQVRECAYRLTQLAKSTRMPLIIVGQVTKEGSIAGPKVLEHLVDTVLSLEMLSNETTRILRVTKNRFGATDEIAIFSMEEKGLIPVSNPSSSFLTKRSSGLPGQSIVATMEGTRPILVEVQALVVPTELPIPRRVATGVNPNRLSMIAAILAKHLHLPLGKFDIFVNVSGGFVIREPAADLGIAIAIFSSLKNTPFPPHAAIGELSLLGEVSPVPLQNRRIKEAKKLGYSRILAVDTTTSLYKLLK